MYVSTKNLFWCLFQNQEMGKKSFIEECSFVELRWRHLARQIGAFDQPFVRLKTIRTTRLHGTRARTRPKQCDYNAPPFRPPVLVPSSLYSPFFICNWILLSFRSHGAKMSHYTRSIVIHTATRQSIYVANISSIYEFYYVVAWRKTEHRKDKSWRKKLIVFLFLNAIKNEYNYQKKFNVLNFQSFSLDKKQFY